MTRKGSSPTPDQRLGYELGGRYSEMNTILRRLRGRRGGEPTREERDRLAVLRVEIQSIKRTGGASS